MFVKDSRLLDPGWMSRKMRNLCVIFFLNSLIGSVKLWLPSDLQLEVSNIMEFCDF